MVIYLKMAALCGLIFGAGPAAAGLTEDAVTHSLDAQGFEDLEFTQSTDDDAVVVQASRDGLRVTITYDGESGAVRDVQLAEADDTDAPPTPRPHHPPHRPPPEDPGDDGTDDDTGDDTGDDGTDDDGTDDDTARPERARRDHPATHRHGDRHRPNHDRPARPERGDHDHDDSAGSEGSDATK